jgi:hypothetical protein
MKRLLMAATLAVFVSTAQAAPITFKFSGTVDSVDFTFIAFWQGIFGGTIPAFLGSTFSGTFTFDPTLSDLDPSANTGIYQQVPAGISGISVTVSGVTFEQDPTRNFFISVLDDFAGLDSWNLTSLGDPTALGVPDSSFSYQVFVNLGNFGGNAFPSDALPTSASLSDFPDQQRFGVSIGPAVQNLSVNGEIESLTIVPEPSTLALFFIGALGVLGNLLRKRRQFGKIGR